MSMVPRWQTGEFGPGTTKNAVSSGGVTSVLVATGWHDPVCESPWPGTVALNWARAAADWPGASRRSWGVPGVLTTLVGNGEPDELRSCMPT